MLHGVEAEDDQGDISAVREAILKKAPASTALRAVASMDKTASEEGSEEEVSMPI